MVLLAAACLAPSAFDFQLQRDTGLALALKGVPVVRGGGFQFYAPGWSKGYYSSTGHVAMVTAPDADTSVANWVSEDGLSVAKETVHRDGNKLSVHYDFDWNGDSPAKVELTAGMLWAPALSQGTLLNDGKATRSLRSKVYDSQSMADRRYGDDSRRYELKVPFGDVQVTSSVPMLLFDGRDGYKQDWAQSGDLLWLGSEDLTLVKGKTTTVEVEWTLQESEAAAPGASTPPKLEAHADPAAYAVPEVHPPLIPKPKSSNLDWDHPLEITGTWAFPAGRFAFFNEFQAALERRFVLPKNAKAVNIDGGVSKLGLTPGAYRLTIRPEGISVVGEKDEGFRYGLQRIARLAFVKDGKLYVPTGDLSDEPVSTFRGVHLFVGPQALDFQRKLTERVLLPLGFNHVVLQCERAAWRSLPGISTSETMSLDDLSKLFKMYRQFDMDPIPLIESFGHDEWLFANGQNLDLVMDPKVPYAVDPRKPRTKELFTQLWDEVVQLLHPTTVHFGLDEVDMRGFPADASVKTELWKRQLGTLSEIAKKEDVKMMLWGDQLLGPQEAPDAALGDTSTDAAERRSAVPAGTMIADWHYLADPSPFRFLHSLGTFSRAGFQPIASTWYKPENIRGFDLAAISSGFGTLQTTWAGYTSSEDAMIANQAQFSAMVLAGDYGWSGRQDDLKDLDYDYNDVFRQMYFGKPIVYASAPGKTYAVGNGEKTRIGSIDFRIGEPIPLRTNATLMGSGAPEWVELPIGEQIGHLSVAMSAYLPSAEGETVGEIEVVLAGGKKIVQPLVYGQQVRAISDSKSCLFADRKDGVSSISFDFGPGGAQVKTVRISQNNQYSGLQIFGITSY